MLVRLFGRNFRSLKSDFELSLVAADLTRQQDATRGTIAVRLEGWPKPLQLLRTVAIFGPNASGKSTVLNAARALRSLTTRASIEPDSDGRIASYEPFWLDEDTNSSPIELGCDVVHDSKLLRYQLSFTATAIHIEKLSHFDENGEVVLINRDSSGNIEGELITASEANQLYVREMHPATTVLAKLAFHGPHKGEESAQPFYQAIRGATRFADYSRSSPIGATVGKWVDKFASDRSYRDWIMKHLVREADVGICDVETSHEPYELPDLLKQYISEVVEDITIPDEQVVINFVHRGRFSRPLSFENESLGTLKLFSMAQEWWSLANESIALFVDELGASLHPTLMHRLISAVNSPPNENNSSQLIFATHDTGLLEGRDGATPALRRDQVYFTQKDQFGASQLYSLAEFANGARPPHNIRKRYLSGLYGAIPSPGGVSL